MRRRSTKEEWIELLALKDDSDLSIKGFCEEFGVAAHQFYYWRKRLREKPSPATNTDFVRVELTREKDYGIKDTGLIVDLRSMQLRLELGFDEAALQKVLAATEVLGC